MKTHSTALQLLITGFLIAGFLLGSRFNTSVTQMVQNIGNTVPAELDKLLPNLLFYLVRIAGLEPARITPLPPQSSASANSAICAGPPIINQPPSSRASIKVQSTSILTFRSVNSSVAEVL